MLTRAEELQNLRKMKQHIVSIDNLKKIIDEQREIIDYQKSRKIQERTPLYVPKNYVADAHKRISESQRKRKKLLWLITMLPAIIYGIGSLIYICKIADQGVNSVILFFAIYLIPICVGLKFQIVPIVVHAAVGGLFYTGTGNEEYYAYGNVFLISATLLIVLVVIYKIIMAKTRMTKSEEFMLSEARQKDYEYIQEYDRIKALADEQFEEEKEKLNAEVQKMIEECRKIINEYNKRIRKDESILKSIPGLADQDKNLYTVEKLITYFERGKADSIKEAINLFDVEERDRQDRERQSAWNRIMLEEQMRAERERKELIEKQEEESRRRYNELKRLENERNEKVDEFIKEVKSKLDE